MKPKPLINLEERFSGKYAPIVFLAVIFLAFGIFITRLGIYQDDWMFVYYAFARGSQGLREFLNADGAPFASLVNVALFKVLGFKPLYWHLSSLIARWLTVTGFWLLLRKLWPRHPIQVFWTCLIFAVHPFFILQPLSFTFLHIWLSYGFLVYSIYWMVLSVDQPGRFWLYGFLSLVTGILSILTTEYFAGLELLRPVVLWLFLREQTNKQKLSSIIKIWLPYLSILIGYSFWRFFIYKPPVEGRNAPVILNALFNNPLSALQRVLANLVPDSVSLVVSAWYKILDPTHLDLTSRRDLIFILMSILTSVGIFLVFRKQGFETSRNEQQETTWRVEAFWLGVFILLLGLIPPYAGGFFIVEKNPLWSSRFGLASMAGASLLLILFLDIVSTNPKARLILLSILIGFSVGYHARYTNDFRYAWKKEQNLYRQLIIRAPNLQRNTPIIAEEEILTYMGDYPTAYAINTIYAQPSGDKGNKMGYWFYGLYSNFGGVVDNLLGGMELTAAHETITFSGQSDQSLIISYEPELGQCLYVLRPEDAALRTFSPLMRRASPLSALDRIATGTPQSPFLEAIGMDFPNDWCAYYQKADLARQNKNWTQVLDLWKSARIDGYLPGAYFEYFPFIDAYVGQGKWADAAQLTLDARQRFPIARFPLCDYWISLPASPDRDSAFSKVDSRLDCFVTNRP